MTRRRLGTRARCLALLALFGVAFACQADSTPRPEIDGWIELRGRRVSVEIAETPDAQAKGLGERDELAWGHGMYFAYERPGFYAFWMKGMRFSIDIVWLRQGRIVDIDPNVPFEEGTNGPTLRPPELVDAVLEVPAGYAAAEGWQIGDRMRLERISAD